MSRPASDSRPFVVLLPGSLRPGVLTCEHASSRLPLDAHWGWDIGAWRLTRDLAKRLETSAIGGSWSRLAIDLNRRVDDAALTRRKAGRIVLPWNDGIVPEEVERRVLAYHAPYHAEIDRLILRRLVRDVRPLLLAVHSFAPRFGGSARPFEIGVLFEHHRKLAQRLAKALRGEGLSVRYNQPYSGMKGMMYAADRHGSHHRLPCLEIEVNQRLFERPDAVKRLGPAIARGIESLAQARS